MMVNWSVILLYEEILEFYTLEFYTCSQSNSDGSVLKQSHQS